MATIRRAPRERPDDEVSIRWGERDRGDVRERDDDDVSGVRVGTERVRGAGERMPWLLDASPASTTVELSLNRVDYHVGQSVAFHGAPSGVETTHERVVGRMRRTRRRETSARRR